MTTTEASPSKRTYAIGHALAQVDGLFESSPDALRHALQMSWLSGASVTRYNRIWYLSKPHEISEPIWFGRIGYVHEGALSTLFWDPTTQDFIRGSASSGVVVPFALNSESGRAVFQLRSGVVRAATFTGALQGLFNTNPTYRWVVRPLVTRVSFEQWRSEINRVTELRFRLDPANPNYQGSDIAEQLIEKIRAQVARVSCRARDGESLDLESDVFRQLLDHVRRDYGRGIVRGVDSSGTESDWDSADDGIATAKTRVSALGGDEAPDGALAQSLSGAPTNLASGPPGESDEEPPST